MFSAEAATSIRVSSASSVDMDAMGGSPFSRSIRFVPGYKPHLELEHLLRHGNVTFRRLKNLPTYSQIRRNIFAFVREGV